MAKDLIDASILHLRARALEQFSIIKGIVRGPTQEQDLDRLSSHIMKLAQFENAMVTLQQYSPHLIEVSAEEQDDTIATESSEDESSKEEPADSVARAKSPTLRKNKPRSKKKAVSEDDDES